MRDVYDMLSVDMYVYMGVLCVMLCVAILFSVYVVVSCVDVIGICEVYVANVCAKCVRNRYGVCVSCMCVMMMWWRYVYICACCELWVVCGFVCDLLVICYVYVLLC